MTTREILEQAVTAKIAINSADTETKNKAPVSYTHLDVYKRQILPRLLETNMEKLSGYGTDQYRCV